MPSFASMKSSALSFLTSPPSDRSPKGTVDLACRELLDLLNGSEEYGTLSSCSGRVSIFRAPGEGRRGGGRDGDGDGDGGW